MKIGAIIVGVAAAGMIAYGVSQYYATYEYGSTMDNSIAAQDDNRLNVLGQTTAKVKEVVQLPKMKTDDLSRIMKDAFEGRYGEGGSKAAFQWIQENYPGQVSDELYSKVATVIEAGRNKFENEQTVLIDMKRQYQTVLDNDPIGTRGWWLKMVGFPKKDLDQYVVVATDHARDSVRSGVDNGMTLR